MKIDTPGCENRRLFALPVITNEVYVEIQVLRRHGYSPRRIAAEAGCAINTVRSHLAAGQAPRYERPVKRATELAAFERYLREPQRLAQPGWIPATVLKREIEAQGCSGGMSQLGAFLSSIRPAAAAADPVMRFETAPGDQMQIDWIDFRKAADPLHAFCATLGYSRASYVEFVSDMKTGTLNACHERAFAALGGGPSPCTSSHPRRAVSS